MSTRDCKALHRGGWGSWQHSDRLVYQEGKKRYFYPLNQDTTVASASSTTNGSERGAGAFNFKPVGPGTYMTTSGVVFPNSVPGRATIGGGDPMVGSGSSSRTQVERQLLSVERRQLWSLVIGIHWQLSYSRVHGLG